jgi:DNA polymerase-1
VEPPSGGFLLLKGEPMKEFDGIDLSDLKHDTPEPMRVAPQVAGRVCHIDADFLAYQVSYDDDKGVQEMKHNCDISVEMMRLMSGAEKVVLHLTPKGSDKGGRYDIALQKEYQGNRKDKPKPKFLHVMREWMHKERGATLHMHCEADDGMSIAQYKAIAEGNKELSIIATKDKDLTMVPGLMLDWDTGEITGIDDELGFIILVVSGKAKKIRGRGWKFFWAQMLMGDSADNIQGLPKVCDLEYCPTGKFKACGPVLTYEILSTINDNKKAFQVVRDLYRLAGDKQGFVNYRDGTEVQWGKVFQSEAQLLWMRRNLPMTDVLQWMKEHCL